jgi:hypothetical protein
MRTGVSAGRRNRRGRYPNRGAAVAGGPAGMLEMRGKGMKMHIKVSDVNDFRLGNKYIKIFGK